MSSSRLLAALALLCGLGFAGTAAAEIPMFNGTCPGAEVHADNGGPVYVNGRQTQLNRINDNYYEARADGGLTLSISRTDDGGVQMSYTKRGGGNGVCQVSAAGTTARRAPAYVPPYRAQSNDVTCESRDSRQHECEMDTRGDVRVVRQLSNTQCVQGENWGLNRHSVWVKNGCRAIFRNFDRGWRSDRRGPSAYDATNDATLLGACNVRARAQGAVVSRLPVGTSNVTELIIDYPDGRFVCFVRNDGYVQSLTPLRRR
ncbi:MAG: DUF3011 domain-containing protein [Proteobacteria bacterium]|nr:DUF3011 domain-containing protein [Pseudomonadota bacterium]